MDGLLSHYVRKLPQDNLAGSYMVKGMYLYHLFVTLFQLDVKEYGTVAMVLFKYVLDGFQDVLISSYRVYVDMQFRDEGGPHLP